MGQSEWSEQPRVHSDELDCESGQARKDKVPGQHHDVRDLRASPSHEGPRDHHQCECFVDLRRMDRNLSRWQTLWKGDGPRKVAGTALIVPDQKAPDAADRVTDRESRRCSCQHWDDRQSSSSQHPQSGAKASDQATEPAHAASAEEEVRHRLVTKELDSPQNLRANQAADDPGNRCVHRATRHAAFSQLSTKQPDSNEDGDREQDAEAGDFEAADAKHHRIHLTLRLPSRESVSRPDGHRLHDGRSAPRVSARQFASRKPLASMASFD